MLSCSLSYIKVLINSGSYMSAALKTSNCSITVIILILFHTLLSLRIYSFKLFCLLSNPTAIVLASILLSYVSIRRRTHVSTRQFLVDCGTRDPLRQHLYQLYSSLQNIRPVYSSFYLLSQLKNSNNTHSAKTEYRKDNVARF